MVKATLTTLGLHELTSEEITSLGLTLDATSRLEDITLIFPWGSSRLSHKRSLNYLRSIMEMPQAAMSLKILQLLGLKEYPRSWWIQNLGRKQRFLNSRLRRRRLLELEKQTGTGFTNDTES